MSATKTRKSVDVEVDYAPASEPGPFLGLVQITRGRDSVTYALGEIDPNGPGRAFTLVKYEGGGDGEATGYVCRTTFLGLGLSCECRGWLAHGNCKHLSALSQLIYRGMRWPNRWNRGGGCSGTGSPRG